MFLKHNSLKALAVAFGLFFSASLYAHGGFHGGGSGYHGGGGYGYGHGHWSHGGWGYGGYGWGGSNVIINGGYYPPYYYGYDDGPDCQIVQHCYPNGDCLQESVCD